MSKKKKSIDAFRVGEHAIFPLHGIAEISDISNVIVSNQEIECIRLEFERKKMSLFLPVKKLEALGLRSLIKSSEAVEVLKTLKETSKFLRVIWNRRSKEYESKIQSGSIFSCAEVVRDLYKNTNNPNRSYTEAVIYEEAFYRVVSEISVVQGKTYAEIEKETNSILSKYHETYQSINNLLDEPEEIIEESFDDEEFKKVANA
jgi:CarD family transcriptional regulator